MLYSVRSNVWFSLTCGLWLAAGCDGASTPGKLASGNEAAVKEQDVPLTCGSVVSDADCDQSLPPIVFVHGTFGSGDQFANAAHLFGSNGYCQDRIVAVEYNSVNLMAISSTADNDPVVAQIDALVDEVLKRTGKTQVELAGHSQGTAHCVNYLSDPTRAAKVAHYINISGTKEVPNNVPTLSISSENDIGGKTNHAPNAEQKVTFTDEDHVDCASSDKSFVEIYKYLMGKEPAFTEVQCGDEEITIEGIAETFGDNEPIITGKIEVYELSGYPRERGEPVLTVAASPGGYIGPLKLKRGIQYEFKSTAEDGTLIGHAYLGPFKRSSRLTRFLAPSTNPLVAALSTDHLVKSPNHVNLVARNIHGSFRHDMQQTLLIGGSDVLTDANAGRTLATVGLFLTDQNQNETTDLGLAFSAPFLAGTDVFMDAKEPAWIHLVWNGQPLHVPNWPSDQGLTYILLP